MLLKGEYLYYGEAKGFTPKTMKNKRPKTKVNIRIFNQ